MMFCTFRISFILFSSDDLLSLYVVSFHGVKAVYSFLAWITRCTACDLF